MTILAAIGSFSMKMLMYAVVLDNSEKAVRALKDSEKRINKAKENVSENDMDDYR